MKKIILILISLLVLVGFFCFLKISLKPSDFVSHFLKKETKESVFAPEKESQEDCVKRISKLKDEEFLKELDTFPGLTKEEVAEFYRALIDNYLVCKIIYNYETQEQEYEKAKSIIEAARMPQENKEIALGLFKTSFEVSQSAVFQLVAIDRERICNKNKKKIISKLKEELSEKVQLSSDEERVIEKFCDQIDRYIKDQNLLAQEIYEFKDWSTDSRERIFQYLWKSIFALRYGGPRRADSLCNSLVEYKEKVDCRVFIGDKRGFVGNLLGRRVINCGEKERENLVSLMCDIKIESWKRFLESQVPILTPSLLLLF